MVPPWVPDPVPPNPMTPGEPGDVDPGATQLPPPTTPPVIAVAPPRRFYGARLNLGKYASSGDRNELRRGIGQYVRTGLGGTGTAGRRFSGTARTAGALYAALSTIAGATPAAPGDPLAPVALAGRSAREIIAAVIEVVTPVDGTQDREASRRSINDALAAVMDRFPEADLLQLSAEQREFAIEHYVALDVYRRFVLDVGNAIRDAAPSATTALARLKEAKDYIRETVVAAFAKLKGGAVKPSQAVEQVVTTALREALSVFQEYAE